MSVTDIVKTLYESYYEFDKTPQRFVSSHWRELHRHVKVKMADGRFSEMFGVGFGDLQYTSLSYQFFSWMTILSYLSILNGRKDIVGLFRQGANLCQRMSIPFSYDCFRQICVLNLLRKKIDPQRSLRVVNIGDGYGFLSAMIKEFFPKAQLILVDLGKTLLFQAHYCLKAHPKMKHCLLSESSSEDDFLKADFIYCPAETLSVLENMVFDVAINIDSMQEMNESTVQRYFDFLRKHMPKNNLFYCCNREEKQMPGGEISKFISYPWDNEDQHLVDEICPWQRHFFAFRNTKNGPKIFCRRIPFINYFDGASRHRLTKLHTLREGVKIV